MAHKVKGQKRKTSSKSRPKCPKERVLLGDCCPCEICMKELKAANKDKKMKVRELCKMANTT